MDFLRNMPRSIARILKVFFFLSLIFHEKNGVVSGSFMTRKGLPENDRALKSKKSQLVQYFDDPLSRSLEGNLSDKLIQRNLTFVVLLPQIESDNNNDCIMPKVLPVVELGIQHIRNNFHFGNAIINVTLISRDTNCSSIFGPIGFFEIFTQWQEVNAVFGLSCEYVLAPVSRYAGVWEVPVLTTGGNAAEFNKKNETYPTLTRLRGDQVNNLGNGVKALLESFNWTKVALIYQNEESKIKGNSICYFCIVAVHNHIRDLSVFHSGITTASLVKVKIRKLLKDISKVSRVVIMCADPQSIRQIMLTAEELKMVDSGEYVFINIELFSRVPHITSMPWFDKNDTKENNERAKKAYTAMLTVTPKQPNDNKYNELSSKIKDIAAKKYNYSFHENEPISAFVTSFFDGVLLYANALNDSIRDDPSVLTRPINGTDMVRRMWNKSFTGITGNVTIDANGDRVSAYSLLDMNPNTGQFEIVADFIQNRFEYLKGKEIHWAGNRLEPPPDKPTCGYDGSLCPDNSLPGYAILSIILGMVVLVMIVCFFIGYRHYKSEAAINSMTWKISPDEVHFSEAGNRLRGSFYSLVRQNSQLTLLSDDIASLNGDRQMFIPVGIYKGCKAAIKMINVQNFHLNRSLMLELKHMKDLQHDHLVKFYGACIDPERSFILMEYCPKGSLQDILENEQFQLDLMFKLSLMHDIVRGMQFLHSSDIKSHGNLKSSNCVVDSRFVLKVTDFGLHSLRKSLKDKESDVENCQSHAHWSQLLWTAPELLKMEENRRPEGTQKGDVYSFGIIVHEILTRQGPFYLGKFQPEKSPQEIIYLVKHYPKVCSHPFRPGIDVHGKTYDDINTIMTKCWAEDPIERPDFNVLKTTIRKINKINETGNIVDNLLKRMEQYANNLEELVEERTQDYLEEKKKCEKLLYQLLPQSVAAQLISGQPVVAETFDQVTIYFSDIVGFTAISAESTPMQVVQFLNDLYTCFDSIVEHFDVYKVETIGDAYMVVSGLPLRNGNQHAREIARLALALLEEVHNFKIHHRPDDHLKLRIGLHTGACVAGVVGLKMPRYCLFGDTVNTASRMESNGEALKIHISEKTKLALDEFGTFITTKRGFVPMKGKGEMLTYWLEGEVPRLDSGLNTNKMSISRRSSLRQPQRNGLQKPHLESLTFSIGNSVIPADSHHLPMGDSVIPEDSYQLPVGDSVIPEDSHHLPMGDLGIPEDSHQDTRENTPILKVKRKISASSPKLNGNEFKTEDFNYHLELSQKEQNNRNIHLKGKEHINDEFSTYSLQGYNKDALELANFRLPLASALKSHNNNLHQNIKPTTSSSNLNGILQPNARKRLKHSPTIPSFKTSGAIESESTNLLNGNRIKFTEKESSSLVKDSEPAQSHENHLHVNPFTCNSKTHLLPVNSSVTPTISSTSSTSPANPNIKVTLNNTCATNCTSNFNNIIKGNNAKNLINLFQNSSPNSLVEECIEAEGSSVINSGAVTQPLLAKINT